MPDFSLTNTSVWNCTVSTCWSFVSCDLREWRKNNLQIWEVARGTKVLVFKLWRIWFLFSFLWFKFRCPSYWIMALEELEEETRELLHDQFLTDVDLFLGFNRCDGRTRSSAAAQLLTTGLSIFGFDFMLLIDFHSGSFPWLHWTTHHRRSLWCLFVQHTFTGQCLFGICSEYNLLLYNIMKFHGNVSHERFL